MNPALYFSRLYQPWFIQQPAFIAMITTLMKLDLQAAIGKFDPAKEPQFEVVNGTAVIPIRGHLALRPDDFEKKYLGMASMDDIGTMLTRARDDRSIRSVMLDIDSPGGSVMGTPDLAAIVRDVDAVKPVVAYSDALQCSAAYFIGSQARVSLASQSAIVGNIGTVCSFFDMSAMFEQWGIKAEVIRNEDSPLKGTGFPGTSLSEDQRAFLQQSVNESAAQFKREVYERRSCPPEAMNGGWYSGARAISLGLVDQIVTRADALKTAQLIR